MRLTCFHHLYTLLPEFEITIHRHILRASTGSLAGTLDSRGVFQEKSSADAGSDRVSLVDYGSFRLEVQQTHCQSSHVAEHETAQLSKNHLCVTGDTWHSATVSGECVASIYS